ADHPGPPAARHVYKRPTALPDGEGGEIAFLPFSDDTLVGLDVLAAYWKVTVRGGVSKRPLAGRRPTRGPRPGRAHTPTPRCPSSGPVIPRDPGANWT